MQQFRLPDVGEGLTEAEIVTWKVKVGDVVAVNDVVVEIETAKSLVELPVPYAGTVAELLAAEGETVPVGSPIIAVSTSVAPEPVVERPAPDEPVEPGLIGGPAPGGRTSVLVGYGPKSGESKRRPRKAAPGAAPGAGAAEPAAAAAALHESFGLPPATPVAPPLPAAPVTPAPAEPVAGAVVPPVGRPAPAAEVPPPPPGPVLAKPPVRKLARDLGVDLHALAPSGPGGTVTRADVERAAAGAGAVAEAVPAGAVPAAVAAPGVLADGAAREVRIPVRSVRRATADAMVRSAFTAPHVTEFVDVDATGTVELLERLRASREYADVRLSPLALVARAVCLAVRRTPEVNATWDEAAGEIVLKRYVNLGIAAATPRGLLVPNVKDADRLPVRDLAVAVNDLVAAAREGRTPPADMLGGTFSITNVGVFGVDTGTPILPPGEAAILALGAIRPRPWVVGDAVVPRPVVTLALSFDHRVVDGEQGSRFLADVARLVEDPAQALAWA